MPAVNAGCGVETSSFVVCPACKGALASGPEKLDCPRCQASYPVADGIPRLLPPGTERSLDTDLVRIKSREEAGATLRVHARIDRGLISRPRYFYGLYLLCALALVLRLPVVLAGGVAFLLADWFVYRRRRGRTLRAYERNPMRVRSTADFEALDRLYEERGTLPPNMDDCIRLLWESSGGRYSEAQWRPHEAERYLDILRVLEEARAEVVVDVGANDGQACWEHGIGRDRTYIGIDINRPLLRELLRRLPGRTALQADASCLPLADGSADFVFCTETLEHLPDPEAAIREFLRVLRPGGRFVVQSPNAHRIRNLNPFELLTLALSLITDRLLQPKTVHEYTWLNVTSYHWDFSVQRYRRLLRGSGGRIRWLGSREFFFPLFLLRGSMERHRRKEQIFRRLPLLRYFGSDLMMVVEKGAGPAPV